MFDTALISLSLYFMLIIAIGICGYRKSTSNVSDHMFGEAALTQADADKYFGPFTEETHAIGKQARERPIPISL